MQNRTRFVRIGMALLLCGAFALSANAATVVTGESLPFSGFSSLSRAVPRVLQQFYDDTFFSAITQPVQITGMSWRLPPIADVTYPTADLNFSRYEISLAKPSAAAAAAGNLPSTTFADNMVDSVLVRSGALTIPPPTSPPDENAPEAGFTFKVTFDTPYDFTPGQDLVMLVRHNGHGDASQTSWNFDGYTWANGSVVNTSNVDATSGSFFANGNKIQFTYVPEPASLALVGLAGLLLGRRKAMVR